VQIGDVFQFEVVVIRDISERSLRYLQEQFLSIANHELRTPLTVIQGYLQLLNEWFLAHPENEKISRYVNKALLQVERLSRLINDINDVSQIQNGKFTFQLAPVNLNSLLAQAVELVQGLTTKQTITLNTDNCEALMVNGDAGRLQQAITNLVTNSIKHASNSTTIELRLRQVDNLAEIVVEDNGHGIPAEHLPELFSRFYQISHNSSSSGLGLGLYICQQITLAHGGTISVSSTLDKGTTFVIRLPLLQENKN
jgi:two-component system CheB/CheR fusion protein